jgi:hypothetical protein
VYLLAAHRIGQRDPVAIVDKAAFAGDVVLAQHHRHALLVLAVQFGELRVLVPVGVLGFVLRPQQRQRHVVVAPSQLLADSLPVGQRTLTGQPEARARRIQPLFEGRFVERLDRGPVREPGSYRAPQALGHRGLAAAHRQANTPGAADPAQQA